jgi:hypothetical protein
MIERARDLGRTDPSPSSLSEVLERVESVIDAEDLTFGDLITAVGRASFVPVLIVPALAVVSPLSGIPLFSSLCGMLIAIVSFQMLIRRDHLWLPRWITSRSIAAGRVQSAMKYLQPAANWLDARTRRRLAALVRPPFVSILQLCCLLCGAVMPLLEIVPFTSTILGAAVTLFALAMLVKDGLLAVLAFGAIAGAVALVVGLIPG